MNSFTKMAEYLEIDVMEQVSFISRLKDDILVKKWGK